MRWAMGGYLPNEECEIVVADGSGGVLGSCPVFDIDASDGLTLPDGTQYDNTEKYLPDGSRDDGCPY